MKNKWMKESKRESLDNKVKLDWLASTEKKLSKDEELAGRYSNIFGQYLEKEYISKNDNLKKDKAMWYLSHFPEIYNGKATSERCI